MGKQFITETHTQYLLVDKHTGEVKDYKVVKLLKTDEFIMMFFESIPEVCAIKSAIEIKVLMGCFILSSYNPNFPEANRFSNSITFKRKLVEIVGDIPFQSIDRAISLLCKRGLLIRHCKGEYSLNPKFFFKGSLSNRRQLELVYKVIPTDNTPFDEDSIINLSEGK